MRASEQQGTVKFISGKHYELCITSKPDRTVRGVSLRGSKIPAQEVELSSIKTDELATRWIGLLEMVDFDAKTKSIRDEWVFTVHLRGYGKIELPLHVKVYADPRSRAARRGSMLGSLSYVLSIQGDEMMALDRRFVATTTMKHRKLPPLLPSKPRVSLEEERTV